MTKARNLARLASVNTSIVGNTVFLSGNVSLANATLSLGANTINSTSLTSTGVVANSYGNTTAIPVITVDAAGRITNATTSSVSGVTGLSYTAANSTVTVSTSTTNFNAIVTSGNSTVQGLLTVIDSVSNTSTLIAGSANSVTTAYLLAANAVSNATAYAATAYSNAVSTAASDATTKAGTAYSNAISVASSDATTKAGTAYSNAIAYANTVAYTVAGTAYSNAVATAASDATTKAGTAYSNATTYAATVAGTAYSNATAYADTKAGTAYSNATAYADTKAGTAYSNAVAYTDIKAGNAYSNAASYADTKAAAAYSNVFNGGTFSGAVTVQANLTANSVRMNGNLQVDGDLTVSGNTVTINVTNLNVEDNMIYLNSNSVVSHPDLGFAGNYNDGSYKHAGLFRDATDGVWKFFHDYTPEPDASAFIDTANASFTLSNLQINYVIGNVTGSANSATYLGGNTAATLRSYSDTMAGTAYSNATSYAATIAGTAYSNAVSVASSDATTKAGTAYSNATTYAATIAGTAYSNATSYAATIAGTAYSNATSYAATIAGTAYSNAVSVAASDATTKAGTAYSNATSYAATIAGTAYSNAVAYAASNSYVNSTFLKLSGGTLTGQLISSTPSNYTAITSVTADTAKFRVPEVSVGGAAGFIPALGQTSVYSSGYRQHLVLGNYRTASTWGGGMFVGLGGNDSYPTEYFLLNYGGSISHTNGYVTTLGSSRSPLFYDSDDTGYYLDPASTSNMNVVQLLNGKWYPVNNESGQSINIYVRPNGDNTYVWRHIYGGTGSGYGTGVGGYGIYNQTLGGDYNLIFSPSGFVTAPYSSRAPIFYDSNNTAFYVNPDSLSRIYQLNVDGVHQSGYGIIRVTSADDALISLYTNNNATAGMRLQSASGGTDLIFVGKKGSSNIEFVVDFGFAATSEEFIVNSSGDSFSRTSSRAPIFYDSNNTGYYVDPASTSILSTAQFYGNIRRGSHSSGFLEGSYNNIGGNSTNSNPIYTIGSAYNPTDSSLSNMYGVGYSHPNFWSGKGSDWGFYTAQAGIVTGTFGCGTSLNTWINGYGVSTSSWRAPIFYDYDDTTYYVDPNSRSVLFSLNVGSTTTIGTGKLSVFAGGASGVGWATGFNLGDASNYTTWIQDGGVSRFRNTGTGGMDWYNSSGGTQIMSLSNAGILIAPASSMRAPIFYDSDNTGYYVDPNSTSQFSYVLANNWFRAQGNSGFYLQDYGRHWYRVQDTYGSWDILGYQNSYAGIRLQDCNRVTWMHDTAGNGGMYNYTYWIYYWLVSDACLGIGTSSTSSSYRVYVGGGIYATGNIVAYSDARKKTNIVTVDNALETVAKLRGVYYNRTDSYDEKIDTEKRQIGVIAQEVDLVLPEAVTYAKDVDEYGVQYGNMAGLFIEAIKEMKIKMEAMELEIKMLKGEV